jgi:tetratricopeptide (TPR) repeat protein
MRSFSIKKTAIVFATFCAASYCAPLFAQVVNPCGPMRNNFGPYDYTNAYHHSEYLPRVEQYHYDSGVQALKGMNDTDGAEQRLGSDLAYTLRAFPNHHRALYTMIRYYLEKVPRGASRMQYDPECWFERARRQVPGDATVLMLEGIYFQKLSSLDKAQQAYEAALAMAPESAEINYNAGLLFLELKDYERARGLATKAYELGYPLPGLRNKLVSLGVWGTGS